MIKKIEEITIVLENLPIMDTTKFPGMTYEGGIREALLWTLGYLPDNEFYYYPSRKE